MKTVCVECGEPSGNKVKVFCAFGGLVDTDRPLCFPCIRNAQNGLKMYSRDATELQQIFAKLKEDETNHTGWGPDI